MKIKKEIIAILLIICVLFTISAINAADTGDEAVSVANETVEVTGVNEDSVNNLEKSNDDVEILWDPDDGSFAALNAKISDAAAGSTVYLENDYEYGSGDSITAGINIANGNLIIDGQGHKIDAKGHTRFFNVNSNTVTIKNINFINGYSSDGSGAIYSNNYYGNANNLKIQNCTFINNHGVYGAIYYYYALGYSITDCTFINNTGSDTGAIYWMYYGGNINNCIFINNSGTNAGSIYCRVFYQNAVISNSIFIGNTGAYDVFYNNQNAGDYGNTLTAENNWWGLTNDNYETVTPKVNSALTINKQYVLDLNLDGTGNAFLSLNNLYENGVLSEDANYALPEIKLDVNGINIEVPDYVDLGSTGKSTITYVPTDAYSLTVKYSDIELTREVKPTFIFLQNQINNDVTGELSLQQDYEYQTDKDSSLTNGIEITKSITINGNGHIIDAKELSNIFYFNDDSNSKNLILKDIIFKNAVGTDGAAVYFKGNKIEVINCTFVNNAASGQGDALYITSTSNENEITQSTFKDNSGSNSIIFASSNTAGTITNSMFMNNDAAYAIVGSANFFADYNWWGNTIENYNSPIANVDGATVSSWLVLMIDAEPDTMGTATVSLNNVYDGNDISKYSEYAVNPITVGLSGINAQVAVSSISLNANGEASYQFAMRQTIATLTATYEDLTTSKQLEYIIVDDGSFKALQGIIWFSNTGVIELTHDYVYSETDTITEGIVIPKRVTIKGDGFTIDAKKQTRIFDISRGVSNVEFNNISFINGKSTDGAVILIEYYSDYCKIVNCNFTNNSASQYAGVIECIGDYCTIENCNFVNNTALGYAGVIYYNHDTMAYIKNSNFTNNGVRSTNGYGGGVIYANDGKVSIDKSVFKNNYIRNYYGSVLETSKAATVTNSVFLNNTGNYILYGSSITPNNNWFGNTFDDYSTRPDVQVSYNFNSWLYLNIKFLEDVAIISLNNAYTSGSTGVYSDYNLPEITLNINSSTLNLNTNKVTLDSEGKAVVPYTKISDDAALTVSYEDISLTKDCVCGDFDILQGIIDFANENDVIELTRNYTYVEGIDTITNGIVISKQITIDGKGHTIDAKGLSRIFYLRDVSRIVNLVLKNIKFVNGKSTHGGSLYFLGKNIDIINCTFENSTATANPGGAVYLDDFGTNIINSTFIKNAVTASSKTGGAVYIYERGGQNNFINSIFINNTVLYWGGAIATAGGKAVNNIDKCVFITNEGSNAKAVYIDGATSSVSEFYLRNSILFGNGLTDSTNRVYISGSLKASDVNNNWWMNTKNNYNSQYDRVYGEGLSVTKWLYLDIACENDIATISLNNVYDKNAGTVSIYDGQLPQITLDLTALNAIINNNVTLNPDGTGEAEYDLTAQTGSLTATYYGVSLTKQLTIDGSFTSLATKINRAEEGSTITLSHDYTYDSAKDSELTGGIEITKTLTIDGQGVTIDAADASAIFKINDDNKDIVLKNINFINANGDNGVAVNANCNSIEIVNCTFDSCKATAKGIVNIIANNAHIAQSFFINNDGKVSVVNMESDSQNPSFNIENSVFISNEGSNLHADSIDVTADYNWFGNTADNPDEDLSNHLATKWYVLNMTVDDEKSLATISLNNLFDENTVSPYENYALPQITLNIQSTTAAAKKDKVTLDENGAATEYVVTDASNLGTLTAEYNGVEITRNIAYNPENDYSFKALQKLIDYASANEVISLAHDYEYILGYDDRQIEIKKPNITIEGNGHILDGKEQTRIFLLGDGSQNILINNLTFINGKLSSNNGYGAAIYWHSYYGNITNCTFINNYAYGGGAIFVNNYLSVFNCTFIDNKAQQHGGAIKVQNNDVIIDKSAFINNDGGYHGGAIYWQSGNNGNVSNSIFFNNKASTNGKDIYYSQGSLVADYNWFGNSKNDCHIEPTTVSGVTLNTWLHLSYQNDAYMLVGKDANVEIVFKYFKRVSSSSELDYDTSKVHTVPLTLTAVNGELNKYTAVMGENIKFKAMDMGDASITATAFDSALTVPLTVKMPITINTVESITVHVGETLEFDASMDPIIEGAYLQFDLPNEFIDIIANQPVITGLKEGITNITVSVNIIEGYTGDYAANSVLVPVNVIKWDTHLDVESDSITVDWGADPQSHGLIITSDDPNQQPIPISVYINDTSVVRFNQDKNLEFLKAGTANITIQCVGNDRYNPSEKKNITVTVKKVPSSIELTPNEFEFDYESSNATTLTLTYCTVDAENITVLDKDSNPVSCGISFENNVITISGLDAGTYTLKVTTTPDNNHTSVEKSAAITVNKIDSSVVFSRDVVFDYGGSGTTALTLVGCSVDLVNISVVGHSEAVIGYDGNVITVSGLDAGEYTLKVVTTPGGNYKSVENTASVTVNKIDSDITLSETDLEFDYMQSGSVEITAYDGCSVDFENITVVGQSGAGILFENDVITVSGLNAGTYTLRIVTTPDKNHKSVEKTLDIKVDKIDSSVGFSGDVVFDYGGSGTTALTLVGCSVDLVNISVVGHSEAVIGYEGNVITVSGLDAGEYTLKVVTTPDGNHKSVENTASVTVNKIDSDITLSKADLEFDYMQSGSVEITAYDGCSVDIGNITVVGQSGAGILFENDVITVSGLNAGTYTLRIVTTPDKNHKSVEKTLDIKVDKIDSSVSFSGDVVFDFGGSGTTALTLVGCSVDLVNISVVGHSEAVIGYEGNVITVSGLDAGEYTLKVVTTPDGNHKSVENTASVTVNKIDSDITLSETDLEFDYMQSGSVEIAAYDGCSVDIENITVVGQSGAEFAFENDVITVSGLDVGEYTLRIVTTPDKNHKSVTKEIPVTVNKIDSEVVFTNEIIFAYEDEGSTISTLTGCTIDLENITIIGHDEAIIVLENNRITVSNLSEDTYTLKVVTTPDKNHKSVEATLKVTVSGISPRMSMQVNNITVGEKEIVFITMGTDATGDVNITILQGTKVIQTRNITINNRFNKTEFENLPVGRYTITAHYYGITNYNEVTVPGEFTVRPIYSFEFNATADDTVWGSKTKVTVNLPPDATGSIKIGNVETPVEGPSTIIELPEQTVAGMNNVTVKYVPDANSRYSADELNVFYNVAKRVAEITIEDITGVKAGDKIDVVATAYPGADIVVYVDGVETSSVENIAAGTHTVVAAVAETDSYLAASATKTFTVTKNDVVISVSGEPAKVGEKSKITVEITDGATGIVVIDVNGSEYSLNISKTKELMVVMPSAGNVPLSARYLGDDKYNAKDAEATFITVSEKSDRTDIDVPDLSDVKVDEELNITVPEGVDVYVDGVKQTPKDGNVSVPTAAGNHTIVIVAGETPENNAVFEVINYTVAKLDIDKFEISAGPAKVGEKSKITVNITEGAAGVVVIDVGGSEYSLNISNVKSLEVVMPVAGDIPLSARYLGDDKYNAKDAEATTIGVTEKSDRTGIDVPDLSDVKVDEELNITVPEGVDVYVDGVKQTPKDGNVSVPTTAGNHTIVIVAGETPENNAVFEVINYTVAKLDIDKFEISAEPAKVGEKSKITVNITEGAAGVVVIDVGGSEYSLNISNVKSLEVVMPDVGSIPLSARYLGDDRFNAKDAEPSTIKVDEKASANIIVSDIPSDIKVGDSFNITVSADAPFTVYVDGIKQIPDENDNVTLSIDVAGIHNITVIADETPEFHAEEVVKTFEIIKKPVEIIIADIIGFKAGDKVDVVATAYPGADIVVYVDGVETSTVENIAAGTHTVVASVAETDSYLAAGASKTFTVTKNDVVISVSGEPAKVGEKSKITVEITDGATGVVVIDVGGSEYSLNISNVKSLEVVMPSAGNVSLSARYLGDDKYNAKDAVPTNITVTEKSDRTGIHVPDLSDVKVDDELNITVPVGVDVYVDGVKQTPVDGNVSVPSSAGNHTIVIVADETADDKAVFDVYNYTVAKKDVVISVSGEPAKVGEKSKITVNITDGAEGVVVIDVDGIEYSINLADGNSIEVVMGTVGDIPVVAKYLGNDEYNEAVSDKNAIKVSEKTNRTDIDLSVFDDLKIGDEGFSIYLPEDVDVYVDGVKLIRDQDGDYVIPTTEGVHTVVLVANETPEHNALFEVQNYTVSKEDSTILIDVSPAAIYAGDTAVINILCDAEGTVLLNVNGTLYSINYTGSKNIEITLDKAGTYEINATYMGNDVTKPSISNTETIAVSDKKDSPITVEIPDDIKVGDKVEINITSPSGDDAKVLIDNVEYTVTGGKVVVSTLSAGSHVIEVASPETATNKANSSAKTFTVSKKEAEITIAVQGDLVADKVLRIVVDTYDGADVSVYLDGEKLDSYNQIMATAGNHVITASVGESDEYLAASNVTSFAVDKKDAEIYVDTELAVAGEKTAITVDIDDDATGIVIINVNGTEYSLNISQSKSLDVVLAEPGDYPVTAKYLGDERYAETLSQTANVHVNEKKKPYMDIVFVTEEFYAGDDVVIAVEFENENSSVWVDGIVHEVADGNVTIKKISAGTHTVEIISPETPEMRQYVYAVVFGVDKRDAEVIITIPDDIRVGDDMVIDVSTNSDGKAVVYVDGVEQAPLRGSTTVRFSAGDHIIVAAVGETDNYMQASSNKTFTVEKLDTAIEVSATNVSAGQSTEITVASPLEEGIVIVQIGDKQVSIDLAKSKTAKVVMDIAGKYDVSARYIGSDVYNPADAENTTVTVAEKSAPEVDVEIPDVKAGESGTVSVSIPNATGEVHIIIDGEDKVVFLDENGNANYTIGEMPAGEHSIVVVYPGDETHEAKVVTKQVNVPKQTSEANITVPGDVKAGDDVAVKVDIPGASGNVTLIVDGREISVPLVNGSAEYPLNNLSAGTHSVVVIYPGDDKTSPATASSSFDVEADIISATEFVDVKIAKDYVVTARLITEKGVAVADADVTLTVGTTTRTVKTASDGSFTFRGENNCVIDVGYAGDAGLLPASTTITLNFTQTRLGTSLLADDLEQYACDFYEGERGGYFKFRLVDSNGRPIADKVVYIGYNGVTYNRTTDDNGYASVQINLKNAGLYTFVIAFLGDDDYNASMAVHKITVNKKPMSISASAKTFKVTAKTKKYTVTLKTIPGSSIDGKTYLEKGKKVTLKINGKTYTAKTNTKGQATFSLKITKKGKFAASISFAGDNTYEKVSKNVKITIK